MCNNFARFSTETCTRGSMDSVFKKNASRPTELHAFFFIFNVRPTLKICTRTWRDVRVLLSVSLRTGTDFGRNPRKANSEPPAVWTVDRRLAFIHEFNYWSSIIDRAFPPHPTPLHPPWKLIERHLGFYFRRTLKTTRQSVRKIDSGD